jgi:hypothetical protein
VDITPTAGLHLGILLVAMMYLEMLQTEELLHHPSDTHRTHLRVHAQGPRRDLLPEFAMITKESQGSFKTKNPWWD